jgi:peptide/bleomycin uptake transporter
MFVSFFPKPKLFFLSVALWTLAAILFWFFVAKDAGHLIGLPNAAPDSPPIVGVTAFITPAFIWFYIYYATAFALFAAFWFWYAPHPWQNWSILGSAFIIFMIYYSVQVDVVLNSWNGTYGDVLQAAMSKSRTVDAWEFYSLFSVFLQIVLFWVIVRVFQNFFIKHYVFRWRTAMNDYFASHWSSLRTVEGAAQRVQEDTMKFAEDMENLGARLIDSVMTLIAFLPLLFVLSKYVTELPIVGKVSHPLVVSALLWTIFGTLLLAIVGRKLPGLEFKNQRVEAAYRKELVYGEDDPSRAQPPTLKQLFADVRTNYFKLYVSYIYFNLTRFAYSNLDNIFGTFILVPSLVTGAINLGVFNQISLATDQVRNSFQYLINVWPDLIKAYSTYKRLRAFESTIDGEELARIERDAKIV